VDLTTQTMSSVAGGQLAAAGKDPIDLAKQQLAGPSDTLYPGAIDALVAACADPRAAAAINEVIRSHPNAGARGWAAFQAATCKDGQTVAALIHALEKDSAAGVRKNAADTLGKLAAREARAALERAQNDPDVSVRGAVGRALKKLP
ncbi:MAG TPA: HEAT repeat domain-containing protein, partial [Haliangium sp.]|nr:HEAT repeat domain-containing protein [Haliangium sp.]